MSSSKKFTFQGTLLQVFICLRSPPLPGFCFGWSSNFVGFLNLVRYKVLNLLQNMVSNRAQHHPPPPSHTLSVYTVRGRGMES